VGVDPGRDFWGLALVGASLPEVLVDLLTPEGFEEAEGLRGLLSDLGGRTSSLLRPVPQDLRPRFERALALLPHRPPLWASSLGPKAATSALGGWISSGSLGRVFVGERGRRFWSLEGIEPLWVDEDFTSAVAQGILFGGTFGWLRRAFSGRRLDGASAYLIALLGMADLGGT